VALVACVTWVLTYAFAQAFYRDKGFVLAFLNFSVMPVIVVLISVLMYFSEKYGG
jgi:ABC-type sulfate transport system permease subunit